MANARIQVEQVVDSVLENLKLKKLGQPYDEVLFELDRQFKHFKAKNRLLLRKSYAETGNVKYYQNLIPKKIIDEVHWSLHVDVCRHPGFIKTINPYGKK